MSERVTNDGDGVVAQTTGAESPPAVTGRMPRWLGQAMAVGILLVASAAFGKIMLDTKKPIAAGGHGGHAGHGAGEKKDAHGDKKGGGHEGHDDHKDEKKIVKLSPIQLKNAGLTIENAAAGTIKETLTLTGIIQPNEEQLFAVLPRFGGVVRAVTKRLGEPVKKGEVVAKIESNESLTQYDIIAPIGGTVIERKGTLGEYADKDKRLMVIADLSSLWVDFRVYQQDFPKLRPGQKVEIVLSQNSTPKTATIGYISPIGMTDTQSMLARAVVDNKDLGFRPGLYVTGRVLIGEQKAPVVVKQSAVQYVAGKPVVFVEGKDGFEARDVEFGLKDDDHIEIIFGVVAGDKVVTGNSFVLKAEIGKGEATHEH